MLERSQQKAQNMTRIYFIAKKEKRIITLTFKCE